MPRIEAASKQDMNSLCCAVFQTVDLGSILQERLSSHLRKACHDSIAAELHNYKAFNAYVCHSLHLNTLKQSVQIRKGINQKFPT